MKHLIQTKYLSLFMLLIFCFINNNYYGSDIIANQKKEINIDEDNETDNDVKNMFLRKKKYLYIFTFVESFLDANIKIDNTNPKTGFYRNKFGSYVYTWQPSFMSNFCYLNLKINILTTITRTLSTILKFVIFSSSVLNDYNKIRASNEEQDMCINVKKEIQEYCTFRHFIECVILNLFDIGLNIKYSKEHFFEINIIGFFAPLISTYKLIKYNENCICDKLYI